VILCALWRAHLHDFKACFLRRLGKGNTRESSDRQATGFWLPITGVPMSCPSFWQKPDQLEGAAGHLSYLLDQGGESSLHRELDRWTYLSLEDALTYLVRGRTFIARGIYRCNSALVQWCPGGAESHRTVHFEPAGRRFNSCRAHQVIASTCLNLLNSSLPRNCPVRIVSPLHH
jgi:hypothetical protein